MVSECINGAMPFAAIPAKSGARPSFARWLSGHIGTSAVVERSPTKASSGIDNVHYQAPNDGSTTSSSGYSLRYRKATTGNEDLPLNPKLGIGAPGGDGYYAE
jgi:hypothetical protein